MEDQIKTSYDVYVSYSWAKHKERVHALVSRLKLENFNLWYDLDTLPDGSNVIAECYNGLVNSKVFLCCLTDAYSLKKHCMRELGLADGLRKPIVFVMFDDVENLSYADILRKIGPPSFLMAGKAPHYHDQIENIVREIKRYLLATNNS